MVKIKMRGYANVITQQQHSRERMPWARRTHFFYSLPRADCLSIYNIGSHSVSAKMSAQIQMFAKKPDQKWTP